MKRTHEGWGGDMLPIKDDIRTGHLLASTAMLALTAAYDNDAGWKKDENGALALDGSGNPIYVNADGRELSVEHGTISRLNNEAKGHRERAEKAENDLKKFEGIIDPAKAREALDTVAALDQSKLIDAGKVDEVKQQITQQYETRLSEVQTKLDSANDRYNRTLLDSAFKSSPFIQDNLAVPADLIQAAFRDRFKVEGDNIVPLDQTGNALQSPKRIGETAGFDEALALWIEQRSDKDVLLKAPDARGSGNNGGGGNRSGGRIVKRSDFDAMPPHQQAEVAQKMGSGEMQIVD